MPHLSPVQVNTSWSEVTGLSNGTKWTVQNTGGNIVYLLSTDSATAPTAADAHYGANKLPPNGYFRIDKLASEHWWAMADGKSRLSIIKGTSF